MPMAESQLLAKWEYVGERHEVLCEGETSFEGAPLRFELLGPNSQRRLIFRQGNDDGSWTTHPAPPSLSPPDARYEGETAQKSLKRGSFRRYFYLSNKAVQLLPNGAGYWSGFDLPDRYPFSIDQPIFGMASSQARDRLLGLVNDSSSDAYFALRFSRSTTYQQRQIIHGFDRVEDLTQAQTQMNRLCRLILSLDVQLWNQESSVYWGLHASTGFWLHSVSSNEKLMDSHLQHWAMIMKRFGPLPIVSHSDCTREFMRDNSLLASGELNAPTFHEQLEARFELREWAQTHLPPDVLAELNLYGL
ncbi:hypothetical protein IAD21_03078 [Abditibacteriota bacterium]|nr:hypothetical protein IAD21_03078 [Abditibacteriota bacterium]